MGTDKDRIIKGDKGMYEKDRAASSVKKMSGNEAKASICYHRFAAPMGDFLVAVKNGKVCSCGWVTDEIGEKHPEWIEDTVPLHPLLKRTKQQLQEYFAGTRRQFDLPLLLEGTPFQQKAWEVLRHIPYGEVITYGEEARRMNHPKAVRAVGGANHANPISIIIPCHRVVAAGGKIGGYGGGIDKKRYLLTLEQAQ